MDELKEVISLINTLPNLALWVIAAFFAYKVAVIGSIYGVIRFGIDRLHSWLTHTKTVKFDMAGIAINGDVAQAIQVQISRVSTGHYIHMSGAHQLKEALDAHLKK